MFSTKIEIQAAPFSINHTSNIMALGSCFAENIGTKMKEACFEVDVNPFGVLYNPLSICNSLKILLRNTPFSQSDIFENNSVWQSFAHSTLFSDISAGGCLNKINSRLIPAADFLRKADVLMITFGTAWIFEDKNNGKVVSNCHKLPSACFTRRRIRVDEITSAFSELLTKLKQLLPHLHVVFSVSPIRHFKDGAHENTVSKSTLVLAIDELQKQFGYAHYFPAYEIQLDELRDYRFYAADMQHPSDVAIDYIWQKFSDAYFDVETIQIRNEVLRLNADIAHRPLLAGSDEYKKFLNHVERKKEQLKARYPFLNGRLP